MSSVVFYLSTISAFQALPFSNSRFHVVNIESVAFAPSDKPSTILQLESRLDSLRAAAEELENSEADDRETQVIANATEQGTIQKELQVLRREWRENALSLRSVAARALQEIKHHVQKLQPVQIIYVGEDILGCSVLLELASDLETLCSHCAFLLLSSAPMAHIVRKVTKSEDEEDEEEEKIEEVEDQETPYEEPQFIHFEGFSKENPSTSTLFSAAVLDEDAISTVVSSLFSEEKTPSWAQSLVGTQDANAKLGFLESLVRNDFTDQVSTLRRLKYPLKIIVGAEDAHINSKYLRTLAPLLPTLVKREVLVPEGAGHFVSVEMPAIVSQQLENLADLCAVITSPSDITGRWIDQMLLNGVPPLEVNNIEIHKVGNGLIGNLSRVSFGIADRRLEFLHRTKLPHRSFIVKIQPKENELLYQTLRVHCRESLFYTRISRLLPRFSSISFPQAFAILEEDSIIVMEDVPGAPLPIESPLDWEHAEQMMRLVATIHSLPFSGTSSQEQWRDACDTFERQGLNGTQSINPILVETVESAWDAIKSWFSYLESEGPRWKQSSTVTATTKLTTSQQPESSLSTESSTQATWSLKDLDQLFTRARVQQFVEKRPSFPSDIANLERLFVHGDLFGGNILRRTDHQDTHHTIIDFQFSHFGNPFQELSFFLYSMVDPFTLMRHETELISTYLSHLKRVSGGEFDTLSTAMFERYLCTYGKLGALYQLVASYTIYNSCERDECVKRIGYAIEDVLQSVPLLRLDK